MSQYLHKSIFYGLAAVLVIPLFYFQKPFFGLFFRQELIFQIAVEILSVFYVALVLFDRQYLPRRSTILIAFSTFIAALLFSTVFSPNPSLSFFSSWERLSGFFSYLHYFLFFLILQGICRGKPRTNPEGILRGKEEIAALVRVAVGAGGVLLLYALGRGEGRLAGTFGNPSFFAAYLIFILFFALHVALGLAMSSGHRKSWLWLGIAGLAAVGVFLTQTRGAVLGLYLGMLVFFAVALFKAGILPRKIAVVAAVAMLLLPMAAMLLFRAFPDHPYSSRFGSPEMLLLGVKNRFLAWQVSLDMFRERPLLGWGQEGFSIAFDKHFRIAFVESIVGQELWFDRAHNIFFDALVAGGAIGALSFLALLAVLFFTAWKTQPILAGAIVAYAIQGMFVFDAFGSLLMLSFLAGYLVISRFPTAGQKEKIGVEPRLAKGGSWALKISGMSAAAVLGIFLVVSYNLKPAAAFGQGMLAARAFLDGRPEFQAQWERAFGISQPYRKDLWLLLSQELTNVGWDVKQIPVDAGQLKTLVALGVNTFDSLDHDERDARYFYQAGRLGNMLGALGDFRPEFIEANLKKARDLSPGRPDIYYELAEFERIRDNNDGMISYLEEALRLSPAVPQTHFNLGIAYSRAGNHGKAAEEFFRAWEMGYRPRLFSEVTFYIETWIKAGRADETLAELYKIAINLRPKDPQLYASLAFLYKKLGNLEEAAAWAGRMLGLDPLLKSEVEAFLETLK